MSSSPEIQQPAFVEAPAAEGPRVEAPRVEPRAPAEAKKEPECNKLFRMVMKLEGSDLHLKVGQPPMLRLKGDIRKVDAPPLTQEDMERMFMPIMSPRQKDILG